MFSNNNVDGMIFVGTSFENTVHSGNTPECPMVFVDGDAPDEDISVIRSDSLKGARQAVSYLIAQGHTHIGLIGSAHQHPSIQERRQGYLEALAQHGIQESYIEDNLLHHVSAHEATCHLLQHAPQVTAIFCCNDDVAVGVFRAAQENGRRIPQDLSVIGFDDTPQASHLIPQLTTMRVHKNLMGSLAVRHLYDQVVRHERVPMTIRLGVELIVRQSVAPCNDHS